MITKEKFLAYEKVRVSGRTNMFNIGMVAGLSEVFLSKVDINDIIRNYGKYVKKFSD